MPKALLYECFAGISGDMHLGALVDLGVPAARLRVELGKLPLTHEFDLELAPGAKMGITGTKASVRLKEGVERPARGLSAIRAIVEAAGFASPVRDRALAMFEAIAVAEARIHGKAVDDIHFHEVGATDSIVDIVGAAVGLNCLGVDVVHCSAVEVGGGMVRCAHGLLPVPAPATAELLKGAPCRYGGVDGEATTPTGAAILKCAVDSFEPPPLFKPATIGYGIGHKDFARPNVLRLTLGETRQRLPAETNLMVECNIDDMPAEAFAPLMDALFAKGAKDVFLTPIAMKKSRPGTRVSVLVDEQRLDAALDELFTASTTIGVRIHEVRKRMLPRQERQLGTTLGEVRVKIVALPNGATRWKVEHDDVAAVAARTGRAYLDIKGALEREVEQALGDGNTVASPG